MSAGAAARVVHVVLPGDIDDPANPSGGNRYDRRACQGLAALGWSVHEHAVPGGWPRPGPAARAGLARVLSRVPDGALVLLDGLVASCAAEVLRPHADRLRPVVLVHLPLADHAERQALAAAHAIVATSEWTRRRLVDLYALPAQGIHVAAPGVDAAPLAPGSGAGTALLCVAAVAPHKGHDLLVEALATVADRPWTCVCVGPLHRDPAFVDRLRRRIDAYGLTGRVRLVGPRAGPALDDAYAVADLFVLASRGETYGMVVTEALARGIPLVATATAGLPESLGRAPDGSVPGLVVPGEDPPALAAALRRWLTDPVLRRRLRRSAHGRRATLDRWEVTADRISQAISGVRAPGATVRRSA